MDIIMRLKPKSKIVLISDALPQAGIKEDFVMNGTPIHIKDDWTAMNDNGVLAGGMQFLQDVAKRIISTTKMTFTDFIRYASINPSRNLHVQKDFQLKEGLTPNFSVWNNKTLKAEKTFIK
jgi:N-acetylglucosamine-6-phosphate deacetylase